MTSGRSDWTRATTERAMDTAIVTPTSGSTWSSKFYLVFQNLIKQKKSVFDAMLHNEVTYLCENQCHQLNDSFSMLTTIKNHYSN